MAGASKRGDVCSVPAGGWRSVTRFVTLAAAASAASPVTSRWSVRAVSAGRARRAAPGEAPLAVSAADRFFAELGEYLHAERPAAASTDRVFTALKGPRRGLPLSAEGLDEILGGARRRAGLEHATCHELRHTCLTRLGSGHGAEGGAGPITVAVAWQRASAGDWAAYAADVARRPGQHNPDKQ